MLETGQKAPDFELPDAQQAVVRLSQFKDKQHVVLYFYPKDDTPGCTLEARDFTRLQDDFAASDCTVLGVSKDTCDSHAAFQQKYALAVRLLADVQGDLCARYGVWQEKERNGRKSMGIVRATFVIDKQGVIRHALYNVTAQGHAELVLQWVREL